jgi:hypothetical protein
MRRACRWLQEQQDGEDKRHHDRGKTVSTEQRATHGDLRGFVSKLNSHRTSANVSRTTGEPEAPKPNFFRTFES